MKARWLALAVLAMSIGCGPRVRKQVEYDPDQDRSWLWVSLGQTFAEGNEGGTPRLDLEIEGKGKHPSAWDIRIILEVSRINDEPDLLGESPKLVIGEAEIAPEAPPKHDENTISRSRIDRVSFKLSLDQLAQLGKAGKSAVKLAVNGRILALIDEQKAEIRAGVAAARRATND